MWTTSTTNYGIWLICSSGTRLNLSLIESIRIKQKEIDRVEFYQVVATTVSGEDHVIKDDCKSEEVAEKEIEKIFSHLKRQYV